MKLWIVVFEHRFGTDVWPRFSETPPDLEEEKAEVDWEGEEKGDFMEVRGPFEVPK